MGKHRGKKSSHFQCILCMCTLYSLFFIVTPPPTIAFAKHTHLVRISDTASSCPHATTPTNSSLLIVLLDRSGSLVAQPGATDADGYSTSTTKALADLWPGNMAVIPFGNNLTPLLGPVTLSIPSQQIGIKREIDQYPIEGNTPLAPAMRQALQVLQQQGYPKGSRVILITDGSPEGVRNNDGTHQEQEIRQTLLEQFCKQGLPVATFGLKFDTSTPAGRDANTLLTDIAIGTSAEYGYVKSPEDLAMQVISLYAQWLDLSFSQVNKQSNGLFPFQVDEYAQRASIIVFRAKNTTPIIITGPDGQNVRGIQTSFPPDKHYEIDNLNVTPPIISGSYTINASNDPDTQVYTFVQSRLKMQILTPNSGGVIYTNQLFIINVALYDGENRIIPNKEGQASIRATLLLRINGKDTQCGEVDLIQNDSTFEVNIPKLAVACHQQRALKQGELHIQVQASYQGVKRETEVTVHVVQNMSLILKQPLMCSSFLDCAWNNKAPIISIAIVVIIAFLLIKRERKQKKQIAKQKGA